MSMKNSNDTIGNQTRDLPACSVVTQPTAPPRDPNQDHSVNKLGDADTERREDFNPLNPELNPICYLLALLGAHHFLNVSRIRVK